MSLLKLFIDDYVPRNSPDQQLGDSILEILAHKELKCQFLPLIEVLPILFDHFSGLNYEVLHCLSSLIGNNQENREKIEPANNQRLVEHNLF